MVKGKVNQVKAIEVALTQKWMAFPIGMVLNLTEIKAKELISRGIAAKVGTAPKNRAVKPGETVVK